MKVPFNDLGKLHAPMKNELIESLSSIIDNSSFILGENVRIFEENFARMCSTRFCTGVSSGTDANHMALWALGIGAGDEVIIPANTFIATAWGVTLCGATPVFTDCEPESYNIDPHDVDKRAGKKTKAVVAVHLYGQTADIDILRSVCDDKDIRLVEDSAQAHLAEYKGAKAGSLGEAASFSFYPGKNLGAIGEAGALTTNNESLNNVFRLLRDHGSANKYEHEICGHNYRMESIQSAALNIKMKHLEEWTQKRRRAAGIYNENLKGVGDITVPSEMSYAKHVYHLYVIKTSSRDKLMEHLNANGISTGLHYPVPLHLQKCFSSLGYKAGDFPVSEDLARTCLSLPIFPDITDDQIFYVCEKIKHFYKS